MNFSLKRPSNFELNNVKDNQNYIDEDMMPKFSEEEEEESS